MPRDLMNAAAAADEQITPDSMFGSYEVVRKLGAGAFGTIFEARRLPIKKRVALKVLHREFIGSRDVVDRFVREAEIVAQIEHPHIVGMSDVGFHDELPYIAMEFLYGESLAGRLERGGAMPLAEAIDVLLPIISAVTALHENGIVHRDLKPDNIFIARLPTGAAQPKLLDFGIAKVRDAERSLTLTNDVMGTPNYMSPEQARDSKYIDGQSDQWSLAVILFECLTGKCPFEGATLLALLNSIATGPIPRLGAAMSGAPVELDSVLVRAMDRAPDLRWASVRALGEALLPFASPMTRAQWSEYFRRPPAGAAGFGPRASVPPPRVSTTMDAYASTGMARVGTLAPVLRTSPLVGARARRSVTVGALAIALTCAGLALAWQALRPGAPDRATAAGAPVERAAHPFTDAGGATVTAATPEGLTAPPPTERGPLADGRRRAHHHHSPDAGAHARARPACLNGFCAPE